MTVSVGGLDSNEKLACLAVDHVRWMSNQISRLLHIMSRIIKSVFVPIARLKIRLLLIQYSLEQRSCRRFSNGLLYG
jgi:hypothetical protein